MIPTKPASSTWTDEQWQAIYEDGKNIIVSAGAGSGKTAVLTERVIRKLKDGVNVNELLILTFTKAAAGEMADRIRKKLKKIPELKDQLNLLDSSYITTFDSFALSIVKRYHYLLNLPSNIAVIDSSVIEIEKRKIIDELFLEYYEKREPMFLKMIQTFCTKDDTEIRNNILNISNKLDLLSNKEEYLESYLTKYFKEEKITNDIHLYLKLIQDKLHLITEKVEQIGYLDGEFSDKLEMALESLIHFTSYDDLVANLNLKLPMAPRGSDEELKMLKSDITAIIKEIKNMATYQDEAEIYQAIQSTKDTIKIMIELIKEFSARIMHYKHQHNSYEFNDIAIFAIHIVKENQEVQNELKNAFKEIMIDEYQDTNDLQEELIQMISYHNVYMVGDIKQSIYRFRNANPYIFKSKYDQYANSEIDLKIDLNKNFRSRSEVLDNINTIFTLIMNDQIGGADYLQSHQMIFGNKTYLEEEPGHSNDMEVYQYCYDKSLGFTKEEIEVFIIAKDILEKYQHQYQVFDKDSGKLRNAQFADFAIIMDRATNFDLYKKIFNYFKIPLTLLKDEKMNEEKDIHLINNLIRFILKVQADCFDTEFKYLFTSIGRSFLYELSDSIIFDYFQKENYQESELYQKAKQISQQLDYLSIHQLLDTIITEFHYYESYIKIGNVKGGIIKFSKLKEMALNLENLGYDIDEFSNYLTELLKVGYKIEYKVPDTGTDSVKIMTIHKSKGLEYPVCYFSGLYKDFNISDLKEKFLADKKLGIIVPYFQEGIAQTIYKDLLRENYLEEEISEKIRLFYVALTRAREKMILIKPENTKDVISSNVTVLDNSIKKTYRSLDDILNSIEFRITSKYQNISLETLNLTKEYNLIQITNYQTKIPSNNEEFIVKEITTTEQSIKNQTFSKKVDHLITKEEYNSIELGKTIHEYLEFFDFKNPNYQHIQDPFILNLIKKMLSQPLLANIDKAKIYQEYAFIYQNNNSEYHGIIDLMLEYDDHIDIIDYKLKKVIDFQYQKQLEGYYSYIKEKTNKVIHLYLYSLLESTFRELK